MSENQNRRNMDLAKYDAMATEELEEILRLDVELPDGQGTDTDTILYIMEVLAERKRDNSHTGNITHEAYETFKQNYMPEADEPQSKVPAKTKRAYPRWMRGLAAAAAVLVLLVTGSMMAKAFGFDIWKAVVQWTQETFHFGDWGNSDTDNNLPYASIQEALEKGNTPAWLVPTYIPEDFSLADIKVEQSPQKKKYVAQYICKEKKLRITIQDRLNGDSLFVEQSDGLVEEYEADGITYYLFSNYETNSAVWLWERYECDISGDVTIEELKKMIVSIQKG